MDMSSCVLRPMDEGAADIIREWEYPKPYEVYSFKDKKNGYLLDRRIWGIEQFYLISNDEIVGQVACQYDNDDLWVGWSLSPALCGTGNGHLFVNKCIEEIRRVKQHKGSLLLRVAAWNERAIKAYAKAGFTYKETIVDGVAGSSKVDVFWVMESLDPHQ